MVVVLGACFCLLICSLLLSYAYTVLWLKPQQQRNMMKMQGIGGPSPSFIFGNIREMKIIQRLERARVKGRPIPFLYNHVSLLFPFFDHWRKQYGPVYLYSTGSAQVLYVSSPALLKELALCKSLDLGKPNYLKKERSPLFGNGILTSNGESWEYQRRIIASEFFMEKVKGMLELVVESAIPFLSSWESQIQRDGGGSSIILVDKDLRSFSADVISRACFGSSYLKGKEIFSRFRELQNTISKKGLYIGIPGGSYLPTKQNQEIWRLTREIRSLILEVVQERKRGISRSDLLQSIIDGAGDHGDVDFIIDNCKNIYFAGQDTTSAAASWCLLLLASHPQWQDKVRDEIKDVSSSRGEVPSIKIISQIKTLTMVVQETLRLYPSASFLSREALRDLRLGDLHIPKGLNIWIPLSDFHRDHDIWGKDAGEFNPARFANGVAGACKLPYAYLPFGVGPRICVGQNLAMLELKVVVFLLLLKFRFSVSPSYVHSPAFRLTIVPEFGMPLAVSMC